MKDRVDLGVFVGMEYVLLPHLVSTNIPYMRYAVHCNFYTRLYIMYDHIQIVHTTSSIVQLFEYSNTVLHIPYVLLPAKPSSNY